MERLTNSDKETPTLVDNAKYWLQVYFKLKDYEDLEEQGLLLRLPCKMGDTIWDNDFGKPCIYTITGPISKKEVIYYYSDYSGSITGGFVVSENGKTVFLTKAEAEQKLKEMESD